MSRGAPPKAPEDRWEWIKYQLRISDTSLAALAREQAVTLQALAQVKLEAYPRMERVIAQALQLRPIDIWPERWESEHHPIRQRPGWPEKRAYKTAPPTASNVPAKYSDFNLTS